MMQRLLITGGAGALGAMCREKLQHLAHTIRVTDVADLGTAAPHEELLRADLAKPDALRQLVDGCDGIVHFGGQSTEAEWTKIRASNVDGVINLYEAVRLSATKPRIFFASSNHVTGFHDISEQLTPDAPFKPDSLYGVSKVFGEAVARLYFDKFGIETACVRIGSCYPAPSGYRMLSTWLSYRDLIALIESVFAAPHLGCPTIYGVSANTQSWWDNRSIEHIDWKQIDDAEDHRSNLPADDARTQFDVYQGGAFCDPGAHYGINVDNRHCDNEEI